MTRKGWGLVAGVCVAICVLVGGVTMFILFLQTPYTCENLGGPVVEVPKHGFLGVVFDDGIAAPLTIASVFEGTPAADAGLQAGDVILAVGGAETPDSAAMQRAMRSTVPGEALTLTIGRGPDEIELSVRLMSFSEFMVLSERERSERTP